MSLAVFLYFHLVKYFEFGDTKAAEFTGMMVGKSDNAVRVWSKRFFNDGGVIAQFKQGKYWRVGVVWTSEELNKLEFSMVAKKKGTFVDSHECIDVVEYRLIFLRRMVALEFLNQENLQLMKLATLCPAI